jgi:hypothetical protein
MARLGDELAETNLISPFVYLVEEMSLGLKALWDGPYQESTHIEFQFNEQIILFHNARLSIPEYLPEL